VARRLLWVWLPAVAQMAAIFVASSIPNLGELPGGVSPDFGHFVGYALLGGLLARALADARVAGLTTRAAALAWVGSAVYGASDEFHQSFVPGRTPDVNDWFVDIAGAAVAIIACRAMAAAIARRRQSRAV
jgi:VanZ family protein